MLAAPDSEYIFKETLQTLIAACDVVPSKENMEMLFPQEPYCTMAHFEDWIKTHASLASFSQWLLVEEETGFRLEGDPDPPTLYQTLAERYHGECTVINYYMSLGYSLYTYCAFLGYVLDILCILIVHSLDMLWILLYTIPRSSIFCILLYTIVCYSTIVTCTQSHRRR